MGKVVLVTGANKGIGYGIVKGLLLSAPEFSHIILGSRNLELGRQAIESLGNPGKITLLKLDVNNPEDISNCLQMISTSFGKLDVLVNNAGWAAKGDAFNYEIVSNTINTNFYGLKHLTEALTPLLSENGHIVNIGSSCGETSYLRNPDLARRFLDENLTIDGIVALAEEFCGLVQQGTWKENGWPTFGYGVSKNLVSAYTRVLNRDFVRQGTKIRVNCIHPGWVKTDMAGQRAELTIEQGAELPIRVVRDETNLSGKYWRDGAHFDFY